MTRGRMAALALGLAGVAGMGVAGALAPEHLGEPVRSLAFASPAVLPPFGADDRGRPLLDYALQGARIVTGPAAASGLLVAALAVAGGLVSLASGATARSGIQFLGAVLGALPRLVVVLVVALLVPQEHRGLAPVALTWALLAAPGAMDEAAAVATRLGGARFVEALRAHGFSRWRIYGLHLVGYNLRPVVVRQAAEVFMQVVFLEIALSYLAVVSNQSSFTHSDSMRSWADLLDLGYKAALGLDSLHALLLGLALVAWVALSSTALSWSARAR